MFAVMAWAPTVTRAQAGLATLVINEIDYDQPMTDGAEFIELKNIGEANVNLDSVVLVLVNGTGGGAAVYESIDLPAVIVPPGGYYVVCGNAATVANCNLDLPPETDPVMNGSPDAVGLAQDGIIIDAVSYEGNTGAPYTEGSGVGLEDDSTVPNGGVSRFPDGADTNQNNVDLSFRCITPGAANSSANIGCVPSPHLIVINEIMQNPEAVADAAGEWLELFNPTFGAIDINGWTVADNDTDSHVITNGGPLVIPAGGFLVLGNNGNAATNGGVTVSYMYSGVTLANGADEVILLDANQNGVDRVEYDDGATFPDPSGASMALSDPALDNNDGHNWCTARTPFGGGDSGTPGASNDCGLAQLVINEIDYDQPGGDMAEFVEIKNVGPNGEGLAGITLELINGTGGGATVYDSIDLPNVLLPAGEYLVVCGDSTLVSNCDLDVTPDNNLIQNGAPDAVALVQAGVIVDTVSYEGDTAAPYTEGSGVGLNDDASDSVGIARCPDGTDTNVNNLDFITAGITPGEPNDCDRTPPSIHCPDDDLSVECSGPNGTAVVYVVTAMDETDPLPTVTCEPESGSTFPIGTTAVMCMATDASGNAATCEFNVSVVDHTAPTVSCTVALNLLWPPNHELVDVGLMVNVNDTCDDGVALDVTVYSDEDDEAATGDGNHAPDAVMDPNLRLRSERGGDGNGRVFLIVTTATDESGNMDVSCCAVAVPHSLKRTAVLAVQAEAATAMNGCSETGSPGTPFVIGE